MLSFAIPAADGSVERLPVAVERLVIAGWTGRDRAKLQEHIDELKELGVAPPTKTPIFYPLSASLVTQDDAIQLIGDGSSGEVEVMLIGTPQWHAGHAVASDHTDRVAEAYSIQICPSSCAQKPIAAFRLVVCKDVADRWDSLTLQRWIRTECSTRRATARRCCRRWRSSGVRAVRTSCLPGWAMPLGTLPVHGGIRGGDVFTMKLGDPNTGQTIEHGYRVEQLAVSG